MEYRDWREFYNNTYDKQPGPVRTVTRREIVPGVYGKLTVHPCGDYTIDQCTADELTDAIATLTAIRDAMQASATA